MITRDVPDATESRTAVYTLSLPPGRAGLDIGLAILDLLEDRFGAELVDFHLGDDGGYFTVKFPRVVDALPPSPAA